MRILIALIAAFFAAILLSGCIHNGIFIMPTAPSSLETLETAASTADTASVGPTLFPDSDTVRPDPYNVDAFVISDTEQVFLSQIHALRAEKALPSLITDEKLCALAYIRAYETLQSFSHSRPDGRSYTTVFTDFGYSCHTSDESILRADRYASMDDMLSIWLENGPFGNKIIDPQFDHIGIGVYQKNGYVFVTCLLTAK